MLPQMLVMVQKTSNSWKSNNFIVNNNKKTPKGVFLFKTCLEIVSKIYRKKNSKNELTQRIRNKRISQKN